MRLNHVQDYQQQLVALLKIFLMQIYELFRHLAQHDGEYFEFLLGHVIEYLFHGHQFLKRKFLIH